MDKGVGSIRIVPGKLQVGVRLAQEILEGEAERESIVRILEERKEGREYRRKNIKSRMVFQKIYIIHVQGNYMYINNQGLPSYDETEFAVVHVVITEMKNSIPAIIHNHVGTFLSSPCAENFSSSICLLSDTSSAMICTVVNG